MLTSNSPPPADVKLPDDVNAEYTAGSGGSRMSPVKLDPKVPLPQSSERVIDSSPAAAPSPSVVRHSDILMQAYLQKQRAERMQAIFQSIGGMVGGLRGEHVSGGGGGSVGPDMGALKTILDQRQAEDQATELLKQKERKIQDAMLTQGVNRDRATVLVEGGEYDKRNAPEELRAAQGIRQKDVQRQMLDKRAGDLAAVMGGDEGLIRAQLQTDPQKVLDNLTPKMLADVEKLQGENFNSAAERAAYLARIRTGAAAGEPLVGPGAVKEGDTARLKKEGEASTLAAAATRKEFDVNAGKGAMIANQYLTTTGKQLGDSWNKDLVTGTGAEFRQTLRKAFEYWADKNDLKLDNTAAYNSALKKYVTDRLRMLPGQASNKEGIFAAAIAGGDSMSPFQIREVVRLNEMSHRAELEQHDEQVQRMRDQSPALKREFDEAPTYTGRNARTGRSQMPEPSKILKDDVMLPANAPVRQQLVDMATQLHAHPNDPKAQAAYEKVAKHFDQQFGARMSDAFLDAGGKF